MHPQKPNQSMEYKPNPLALKHIALACQEALKNKQRVFVAIGGLPGTGKAPLENIFAKMA